MSKTIRLLATLAALAAGSANATPPIATVIGHPPSDEGVYGFVVNTDGGTFDGVALIQAVHASADLMVSPRHMRARAVRADQ